MLPVLRPRAFPPLTDWDLVRQTPVYTGVGNTCGNMLLLTSLVGFEEKEDSRVVVFAIIKIYLVQV